MNDATEARPFDEPQPIAGDDEFDEYEVAAGRRAVATSTVVLLVAVLMAAAFSGGVLAQKRHDKGLTASRAALPAGLGAAAFGARQGGGANNAAVLPSGAPGAGTATEQQSGPVLVGTVVSVSGTTATVKDLGGTTHTVTATDATTVTKSQELQLTDLAAGQTVVITGTRGADGGVAADSVTVR